MSVFRYKGGNIFYAGFGARGQYFVRSLGTSHRREAESKEKKLRALAEAGRLPLRVSAEDRAASIKNSLGNSSVARSHRAGSNAAAQKRKKDPAKWDAWIASIKDGQADPTVKSKMAEANQRTATNPVSKRRKRRSLKRMWKRRGHRGRVIGSLKVALATPAVQKRRADGRLRWAAELLEQHGYPSAQGAASAPAPTKTRRKRKSKPQNLTERFRIGSLVEQKVGGGPFTKSAIVSARFDVAAETGLEYDTVKKYHLAYLGKSEAVPDRGPTGDELVNLSPIPGTR
jgi:hypothetical protein